MDKPLFALEQICVGADYRDQFKKVIDAGGTVGGVVQHTSKNSKQDNAHATGGRTSGSASQGLLLDGFIVCVSDAKMEMSEWINYLVMRSMPILIVD